MTISDQTEIFIYQELIRWLDAHRVLEAEERHLQLADSCAVEVQLQFELRQGVGNYFPVRHPHKISQTCHQCGDMLMLQFGLLRPLYRDTNHTHKKGHKIDCQMTNLLSSTQAHESNRPRPGSPVSAPPAGEALSSLCPRSGFGVKSLSFHCLSSA